MLLLLLLLLLLIIIIIIIIIGGEVKNCCNNIRNALNHFCFEIKRNANFMQHVNFIDVFLARYVSGTYAHHQEH